MTDTVTISRSQEMLRALRAFLRAEDKHAKDPQSRSEVDTLHAQLVRQFTVNDCDAALAALSSHPPPSGLREALDDALVAKASAAVCDEWQKMIAEIGVADAARSFVSPTNHRLVRACLRAALASPDDGWACQASASSMSATVANPHAGEPDRNPTGTYGGARQATLRPSDPAHSPASPDDGWVKVDEGHPMPGPDENFEYRGEHVKRMSRLTHYRPQLQGALGKKF